MSNQGIKYNTAGFPLRGELSVYGLDIKIEQRKGDVRSGTSPEGKRWKTKMLVPYGYIENSKGSDEDCVDCFIGDSVESNKVFVIHQVDPKTGEFDEDKVMLGFDSAKAAKSTYLKHYDTPKFFGSMEELTVDGFKESLKENFGKKLKKAIEILTMSTENQEVEENDLEKGNITQAFGRHGDKQFKITKKGSDLKIGLEREISTHRKQMVENLAKAKVYLEYIKEVPTEEVPAYTLEPYTKESIGETLPMVFDDTYGLNSSSEAESSPSGEEKTRMELKYRYNRCIRKAIDCLVEARFAETMQGGIEDKKTYELSVAQAAVLGL